VTENETRIRELLEEILESDLSPEVVCADDIDLLPVIRSRLQQIRRVGQEIDDLFPSRASTKCDEQAIPPIDIRLPSIEGYVVESVLGSGGMGVVYRARQQKLSRDVALKMLLSGPCAGPLELARFRREAEAVAILRHCNIVQVYDVGDTAGRAYFTMELVEGGTLAQKLAERPLPSRQAADLTATLASAVHFAHKCGIIHRDIKPSNILMMPDGVPKITDFGLARVINRESDVTWAGSRVGTPSYMAPEQAMGVTNAIGPTTDVYALGALLYEMLTGRPPFKGSSAVETEQMVINDDPIPPPRINPKVPADLSTICLKCLDKNPTRRYASAQDLADDLHRFLDDKAVIARPIGSLNRTVRWVRRRPAAAGLVLSLFVLITVVPGVIVWQQRQESLHKQQAIRSLELGLAKALELGHSERWTEALQVLHDLKSHHSDQIPAEFESILSASIGDFALGQSLEEIRQKHASAVAESFSARQTAYQMTADCYARAFADARYVIDDPYTAVRIRLSKICPQVIAALDLWAFATFVDGNETQLQKVLTLAQNTDEGSVWRAHFRDVGAWRDRNGLIAFAERILNNSELSAHQIAITAFLLSKAGAETESMRLLRSVLERNPRDFWLNWEFAMALEQGQNYPEAVTYFRIVRSLRPENPWILNRLAGALAATGERGEAIALTRRAVELNPKNEALRHNVAVELLLSKRSEEAIAECREILKTSPNHVPSLFLLGRAYQESAQDEKAIEVFQHVVENDPRHHEGWYELGNGLATIGKNDNASVALDRSLQVSPDYFLGHVGRGQFHTLLSQHQKAADDFEWIVRTIDSDNQIARRIRREFQLDANVVLNDALTGWARALCSLGRFDESRKCYSRLIQEKQSTDSEIWFEWAAVQLLAGDINGYRQACQHMIDAADRGRMRNYLAARVATLAPMPPDSIAKVTRISGAELQSFKDDFWSLTEQGALRCRAQQHEDAKMFLERSLQAEPKPGAAVVNWLWLALSHDHLGDTATATSYFEKARSWLDSLNGQRPANSSELGLHLHNWLEARILISEMESLMKAPSQR
jgi:serine/threonine-protein kinase